MSAQEKSQRPSAAAGTSLSRVLANIDRLQSFCKKWIRRLPRIRTATKKKAFAAALVTVFLVGFVGVNWIDWA